MNFRWTPLYNYYRTLPKHPDGDFFSCAVRMSISLNHVGSFNKASYKRSGKHVSAHGWATSAEELYQWVRRHGLGEAEQIPLSPSDWSMLPQRNGIVYLRNCYIRGSEKASNRSGDHFDLYVNGQGMLSAIRWPVEFTEGPFGLMVGCRDGYARFWEVH